MPLPASSSFSFRPPDTPAVRMLITVLVAVHGAAILLAQLAPALYLQALEWLALVHPLFWRGYVWTAATYGALHDVGGEPLLDVAICAAFIAGAVAFWRSPFGRQNPGLVMILFFVGSTVLGRVGFGSPFHLLGNVMVLWFFGPQFERLWGATRFVRFCIACVAGGALLSAVLWWVVPRFAGVSVIGASAASFGLITALAVYFPDAQVLYGFVIPLRGKHLILIAFLFDIVGAIGQSSSSIFAHAGGALTAFLWTTGYWRPSKLYARFGGRPRKPPPKLRIVKPGQNDWIQ